MSVAPLFSARAAMHCRRALVDRYGTEAFDAAIRSLSEEQRVGLLWDRSKDNGAWVPLATMHSLWLGAAKHLQIPVETFLRVMLTGALGYVFRSEWRIILTVTPDDALLARATTLWRNSYAQGSIRAQLLRTGVASLEVDGWRPEALDAHCIAIAAEQSMLLSGRCGVRVQNISDENSVRFLVQWDAA